MRPVKEHIEAIRLGWGLVWNTEIMRKIRLGFERVMTLFWMLIGGIGPYRLMRYMYGAVGAINLVLITSSDIPSGMDIITQSDTMQYWIAFGMIAYAMLLEKDNIFMLTLGSLGAVYYAMMVGSGTVSGVIDIRGALGVTYLLGFAASAMVASYAAFIGSETHAKLLKTVSEAEAWRDTLTLAQKQNKRLKELLVEHGISVPESM